MAITWNPKASHPPYREELMDHLEIAICHADWGRKSDLGFAADTDGEFVGLVFCRLFTDDEHGHGYVDAETPELGVAIVEEHRGDGIGGRLMGRLADQARIDGYPALSLSVAPANPAQRLYQRLGYREISRDEESLRMVLHL